MVMLETRDATYGCGYAPAYAYDMGRLDTSLAFAEIKQCSHINARAEAAVAALIAPHERQCSGLGQHVDISAQQAGAPARQSGILATPLNAVEFQRLYGGMGTSGK